MHANALFARDCLDTSLTANDKTRSMYDDKTINFELSVVGPHYILLHLEGVNIYYRCLRIPYSLVQLFAPTLPKVYLDK